MRTFVPVSRERSPGDGRPPQPAPGRSAAPGHVLPRQHCGRPVDERAGAARARGGRAARCLQPLSTPPRGRPLARLGGRAASPPGAPVARVRAPAPTDGHFPLRVRVDARAAVAPVPDSQTGGKAFRLPLPRLRHPWEDARATRVREEGGCGDRWLIRRDPLGARGARDPAGNRRPRDRPDPCAPARPPARRARPLLTRAQGHGSRHRRLRRT